MRGALRKLWFLLHRAELERDLDEEMRHHLALRAEERGSPEAALRQFRNVTLLKEQSRAMWTWTFWEQLTQDIRYGLRTMAANPLFTALAVLSLALGIGASTAIYSFMDAILMRSLPVSNPETLALMNWKMKHKTRDSVMHGGSGNSYEYDKTGTEAGIFPYPAYEVLRKSTDVFSSLFAYYPMREINLMVHGQAEVAHGEFVSGEY